MDFGRLPTVSGLNLTLPPDDPATARILARATPVSDAAAIRIGVPTFANKPWIGSYYPAGAKDLDLLRYYGQLFPTLELNSTHYGLPDRATVTRWRQQTPAGFRFCPKLPQRISHDFALDARAEPLILEFGRWLDSLADRVGTPFVQLPPTLGPDELPTLERFLLFYKEALPTWSLAVELRHPLWFASPLARAEVFSLLEALEMTAVISDVAGRRDVLHQRLTTPVGFIRFNGHGLEASDYSRADAWAERLADWLNAGLREVWFFIHQKDIRHTPVLARYLTEQLNARTNLNLPVPTPAPQPVQGSLF